jgi:hypothetical protein
VVVEKTSYPCSKVVLNMHNLNFKIYFFGFFLGTLEVTTLVWWKMEIGYCYDVVIDQKLSPK